MRKGGGVQRTERILRKSSIFKKDAAPGKKRGAAKLGAWGKKFCVLWGFSFFKKSTFEERKGRPRTELSGPGGGKFGGGG